MTQKLSHIFKEMSEINPPQELGNLILQKISLEKNRRIRRNLFVSYTGLIISSIAIFPAILKFGVAFFRSEFWSILSLAFSDFMIVAGSWKSFLYSLGETLPIMYVVAMLIPIFAALAFGNILISLKNKMRIGSKNFNMHFQN